MAASPVPALAFLRCRTPAAWCAAAADQLELLLQDHATLELKAAQQAQKLIWKYGAGIERAFSNAELGRTTSDRFRAELVQQMSRLAREELRHFEQVNAILADRGLSYSPVSASRYAAGLHARVSREEPNLIVDTLLVSAIIEARSCERFASLVPVLDPVDPVLAKFYASLLKSEARHYQDYLRLARSAADELLSDPTSIESRLDVLLDCDRELIESADTQLRFHSGVPWSG